MHDVYDDHLSDCSPSLAQAEQLDGALLPFTAPTEDCDPSAFGVAAAEAAPATDYGAEEGYVARGSAQPSQPTT